MQQLDKETLHNLTYPLRMTNEEYRATDDGRLHRQLVKRVDSLTESYAQMITSAKKYWPNVENEDRSKWQTKLFFELSLIHI